ncbi:L-seryl-tRNA(Sec) kinase [Gastrophryne carolinensis]
MANPNIGLCVLCGLPGAGKSSLAAALREQQSPCSIYVICYDAIIPKEAFSWKHQKPGGRESQWKQHRQHVLQCLDNLLMSLRGGTVLQAPNSNIEGSWERFCECLEHQGLLSVSSSGSSSPQHFVNPVHGPLYFLLDDNFYYQSMRYEVYQLARKYSLGFCQLYLQCSTESCLLRNRSRPEHVMDETILLMERKIERPNPEKNMWEMNSLLLDSCGSETLDGSRIRSLLNQALDNPVKPLEDDSEEKARDREICAASLLHQTDQSLRRLISETMQAVKGSV